jgi:hypothetical protein
MIGNIFMAKCSMVGPWFRRNSVGKQRLCSGEKSRLAAAVLSNIGRRLTLEGSLLLSVLQTIDMPIASYSPPVLALTITIYILEMKEVTATISIP